MEKPEKSLLMVAFSAFYTHFNPINYLIRFEYRVFRELIYRFRLGKLSPCSLLGWGLTFFHLKEVALLVVGMFWGVGGVFVLTSFLSWKVCYKLEVLYNHNIYAC